MKIIIPIIVVITFPFLYVISIDVIKNRKINQQNGRMNSLMEKLSNHGEKIGRQDKNKIKIEFSSYLEKLSSTEIDEWGNKYNFTMTESDSSLDVKVISSGQDKIFYNEDDYEMTITVWLEE